ncbi:TraB/GumN family protein [Neorhizobium sp. NPDC001467]|uniref:TraB/GumN family protein n=1 Tax=Neorhizobium sp. NPDC001467 TaxID=3390595 RepID=UPI003D049BE0
MKKFARFPSGHPFALPRPSSDIALWLLAAIHVIVIVSFMAVLASLSPARAQDAQDAQATACTGANLLEEMKSRDPQRYAQVLGDAEKVPNGKGLFWRIEKPGVAPSYLLGTMHVTDPRVLAMPAGAAPALQNAKTIAIESDEILDEAKAMAGLMAKPDLLMFTDGNTIRTLLPDDQLAKLEAALTERGIPLGAVQSFKPWMISGMIAVPACELARKKDGTPFLDKKIALDAIAAGKPVKGLETMEEQLSAMAALPLDLHVKALEDTLSLGARMDDVTATMTDLYLAGDVGVTVPMLRALSPEDDTQADAGYAAFEEMIVTRRNHVMAERAAPLMKEGGLFLAVGALHLPGQEGLIELLRKQGFTVTPAI